MRVLFLALVLVNLVFFFWQYTWEGNGGDEMPVVQLPPPDGTPPLELLSKAKHHAAAASPAVQSKACFVVGPFADQGAAETAAASFRDKGLDALYDQRETQSTRYWLHTSPYPSRRKALDKIADLKKHGIEDVAVMETGQWQNSISLGFYHNRSSADQRREELQALNVDVTVAAEQATEQTHWVRYTAVSNDPAADTAWQALVQANPKLQREALPCR